MVARNIHHHHQPLRTIWRPSNLHCCGRHLFPILLLRSCIMAAMQLLYLGWQTNLPLRSSNLGTNHILSPSHHDSSKAFWAATFALTEKKSNANRQGEPKIGQDHEPSRAWNSSIENVNIFLCTWLFIAFLHERFCLSLCLLRLMFRVKYYFSIRLNPCSRAYKNKG